MPLLALSGWSGKKWPSWSSSSVDIAALLAPRCAGPWAVDDEVPGAVEEETGQAARCAVYPQSLLMRCMYMPFVRLASVFVRRPS